MSVVISNLTKSYKDNCAVNNVSLTINEGKLFALLGVNGAGKTTLIKMLCGLTLPTSGTATILGYDLIKDINKIKEILNISPQESAVAHNLTVKENLMFIARLYGFTKLQAQEKVQQQLEELELTEVANKKVKLLSGGMQRRVSIAMALITSPKILFLDEPSLGLDVLSRNKLWQYIEKLKQKTTIVLTTHYMEEVEALADNVAVINKGEIIDTGTIDELKKKHNVKTLEQAFIKIVEGAK
ncbi:MAG: ATP-binding cassette domain-containing protein [Clostridia bacterium]|nr:ATP-binding cassette domain-containing protein [Clostridia bacterium]